MFSNDKNIELLARLIGNLRHYGELRLEGLRLDMVSKITMLVSSLIVGILLTALVGVVVMFLSFAAVFALAPIVGGFVIACLIVAGGYLLVAGFIFKMRRRWIIDPIARLLVTIFLSDEQEQNAPPSGNSNQGYHNYNSQR